MPSARAQTLTEARDQLVAIVAAHRIGELVRLAGPKARIEYTHHHEGKRRQRTQLDASSADKLAAALAPNEDNFSPTDYVNALFDDENAQSLRSPRKLELDQEKLTIVYYPEGSFDVTFAFAREADGVVLVGIHTSDEEP